LSAISRTDHVVVSTSEWHKRSVAANALDWERWGWFVKSLGVRSQIQLCRYNEKLEKLHQAVTFQPFAKNNAELTF